MPRRPRSADDPPTRTPSFVCEVALRVSHAQERTLLARLEAARQVRVTCLGEARRRVRLVRESKAFQHARTLPRDDPARKERFREARARARLFGVRAARLRPAVRALLAGRAPGQPDHSDAGQSCLSRRQSAAGGQRPPGAASRAEHQLDTVEGKTNTSGLRWCGTRVEWKGLELEARLDPHDLVQAHGLACPVKYVRLVRRTLGERNRFYAQLVCQGTPLRKPHHQLGSGIVGLDLGPSALAVVRPSRPRSCRRSVPRWLPTPKRCAAWIGSSTGSAGPTTRPTTTSGAGSSGESSAGRCPSVSGRCWRGGVRCTGSWPPPASAAMGNWPIGCWRWAAPFTWSSSPTGRGRGPTGSPSSSARPECLSSGCLAWL